MYLCFFRPVALLILCADFCWHLAMWSQILNKRLKGFALVLRSSSYTERICDLDQFVQGDSERPTEGKH